MRVETWQIAAGDSTSKVEKSTSKVKFFTSKVGENIFEVV